MVKSPLRGFKWLSRRFAALNLWLGGYATGGPRLSRPDFATVS